MRVRPGSSRWLALPDGRQYPLIYGAIMYAYNDSGTDALFYTRGQALGLGLAGDWLTGLPETKIQVPSDMIALGDICAWAPLYYRQIPLVPKLDGSFVFSLRAHAEGANLGFCDGHLELVPTALWQERSERMRRRWNCDPFVYICAHSG